MIIIIIDRTLIFKTDRTFIRYTASKFATQQHNKGGSFILLDNDATKQHQQQHA